MLKHGIWLGPLVVFLGVISYFLVFARFPAVRDFPWINLPIVFIGLAISTAALRIGFRPPATRGKKIAAVTGLTVSLLLTLLFNAYVFILSYQLPEPTSIAQIQDGAPDFSLTDHNGNTVRRSDYLGRKLVIVFYRGHW